MTEYRGVNNQGDKIPARRSSWTKDLKANVYGAQFLITIQVSSHTASLCGHNVTRIFNANEE